MKLVIGGSTGFVATELIRQALEHPKITSIVALGRREILPSPDEGSKLRSIVCDNFENYSDSVKKALENADACIWYGLNSVPPYLRITLVVFQCFPVVSCTSHALNK